MGLMSRGNNVKRCDTLCKSAIKMPSLLLLTTDTKGKKYHVWAMVYGISMRFCLSDAEI